MQVGAFYAENATQGRDAREPSEFLLLLLLLTASSCFVPVVCMQVCMQVYVCACVCKGSEVPRVMPLPSS